MRRKDRQIDEEAAKKLLCECEYATIATTDEDNSPYCIPISPVLLDDIIYFHCANEGKKLTNILNKPNICISCVKDVKLVPEKFTTQYQSAVAFGECFIVEQDTEKETALKSICEKYAYSNMGAFKDYLKRYINATTVCKIHIKKITGKSNIPK